MDRRVNQNDIVFTKDGPIWSVKVGVYTYLLKGMKIIKIQNKKWKIKEILN